MHPYIYRCIRVYVYVYVESVRPRAPAQPGSACTAGAASKPIHKIGLRVNPNTKNGLTR